MAGTVLQEDALAIDAAAGIQILGSDDAEDGTEAPGVQLRCIELELNALDEAGVWNAQVPRGVLSTYLFINVRINASLNPTAHLG